YIPRQFAFRGDRLAFSYGIVLLATIAAALLVFFGGDTHALIPLYSVGVFVCFTLSQIGMVRHWSRHRERGWWWRAAINGFGAVIQAVNVGRSISEDVRAVFITENPEDAQALRDRWERQLPGVPLVVVESPYRALTGPLEAYLDVLDAAWPPDKTSPITFVVLPEYVARRWWERILYNQSVKRLR